MTPTTIRRIRNLAALLMTASGLIHIATLWFREISTQGLMVALFGAFYLIIGIGLLGQSRFSLFIAVLIPGCGLALALANTGLPTMHPLGLSLLGIDVVVILCSALVLFWVRNNPST